MSYLLAYRPAEGVFS
jgi:hypothetical protein